MRRRRAAAGTASALLGLVLLSGSGAMAESRPRLPVFVAPLPQPRPADTAVAQPPLPPPRLPPKDAPAAPAESSCHAALTALGIRFAPEPAPTAGPACVVTDPVRLEAIAIDGGEIRWPDRPLVGCAFARVLGEFTRDIAQPLARSLVGRPLTAFGTAGGFECRGRNRAVGGRVSAHGTGRAVDIAWFAFDGVYFWEESYRVLVAEALRSGWAIPLQDLQADPYSGGSLVFAALTALASSLAPSSILTL
ncbi:MAG: extensin family protein, partial [Thermoleophilia bacterium]|nr:extensin family protein [Thermoleophilia bacterium]